jgi:hypothetical protein
MMMLMQSRGAAQRGPQITDVWFTPYTLQEAYDAIVKKTREWEIQGAQPSTRSFFLGGKASPKFEVLESIPPRLYKVRVGGQGEATFELTEVKGGGASVKTTYSSGVAALMRNFKANFPIQVPAVGKPCSSCGKPIMTDYQLCPYCGKSQTEACG